jgi:preprotein translocase subunit SecF
MLKKAALLCALVVLVSVVSVFAAGSDTPLKTQNKTQLKLQDCDCIGECISIGNQIQTKLLNQERTQNNLENQEQTQINLENQEQIQTQNQAQDGNGDQIQYQYQYQQKYSNANKK